jgi:hypothetical protein
VRLAIVIGAAAAALCLGVESAQACSCVRPNVPGLLAQSDAAFVGTFVSRRPATPRGPGPISTADPDIFTFRVDETIKGELGREVEVWSAMSGASCGLEVRVGEAIGLFLRRDGDRWRSGLCWQVSPAALREALRPLPAPDGRGPVRYLVGGQFAGARLLALDARGRTLGYGRGSGSTEFISVCPRGRRSAEVVSGTTERLAVRDIRTLTIVREVPLPTRVRAAELFCRDRQARDIYVFARGPELSESTILRVRGTKVREIYTGPAHSTAFRGNVAFISEGTFAGDIIRLDLATGVRRLVARLPFTIGHLAVNPAGVRIAGVQSETPRVNAPMPPPDRLVLLALGGRAPVVRSVSLGSRYFSGEIRWLDDARLAVFDHSGLVRVFAGRLKRVGPIQTWQATDTVVASGVVYGLARSPGFSVALEAAKLPADAGRHLRQLPGAPAALATVPGSISLRLNRRLLCLLPNESESSRAREAPSRRPG